MKILLFFFSTLHFPKESCYPGSNSPLPAWICTARETGDVLLYTHLLRFTGINPHFFTKGLTQTYAQLILNQHRTAASKNYHEISTDE